MKKYLASAAIVLNIGLLFSPVAHAAPQDDSIPVYDVPAYCARISKLSGMPSQMLLQGCYQMEQDSYNALHPVWATLPVAMRRYCTRIAASSMSNASYMLLNGCVEMEQQSTVANQNFQFKR